MQVDHKIYGLTINTSASLITSRGSATPSYKLSRLLFSRVLASHAGSPGSILDRDMSDLGSLDLDLKDPGQVSLDALVFHLIQ